MTRPRHTVALELYDRHVPLFMGSVRAHPLRDLDYLEVGVTRPGRDGSDRHRRMLQDSAYDIAELSLAGYLIARANGAALNAIAVFPRRLFSEAHVFVSARSGITQPGDLAGKRIGVRAFQVTMTVQARGDLQHVHGVDLGGVTWVTQRAEHLPFRTDGLRIEAAPEGQRLTDMLREGEIDALIDPGPPEAILRGDGGVRPLFDDPVAACLARFRNTGAIPPMHVLAFRADLAEAAPDLPRYLFSAWEEAKRHIAGYWRDMAFPHSPLAVPGWRQDRTVLGDDPWPSGLAANRAALQSFAGYLVEQGHIARPPVLDALFHPDATEA